MSHPIGTLVQRLTPLALYEYGQLATRAALDVCAETRYATAACELEAAADCAATLAAMLDDHDPARAAAQLAVADHRETWAYQAWQAAACHEQPHRPDTLLATTNDSA